MNIFPPYQSDFYKTDHKSQYPPNTTLIYSNLTPRKSRSPKIKNMVFFGLQYFIKEYMIKQWNENFFSNMVWHGKVGGVMADKNKKERVIAKYKRMMDNTLGPNCVSTDQLAELWDLGYLPLEIRALPEGSLVPMGVPCLTVKNTLPQFYWLTNFFETILSTTIWGPCTSATIAFEYRKILDRYAEETSSNVDFVQFQGHDFSMRGMFGLEAACMSGAGHLLSFVGTDTIPAIQFLEDYYNANITRELVGTSVPATEHSVMCAAGKDFELDTYRRLITKVYPKGIVSIVSDTWNLWNVLTKYLPDLKQDILSRDGKVVIRPDSGNPVRILTGYNVVKFEDGWVGAEAVNLDGKIYLVEATNENREGWKIGKEISLEESKGVIELLWEVFGGTVNEKGYKELDSHIGAIYGDSITLERAEQICERLKQKGFASTNVVLGIGSYTYQYNTRDTFGMAVKSTYTEVRHFEEQEDGAIHSYVEPVEMFKDPITDDGTKKSAKGLLRVTYDLDFNYHLVDQVTPIEAERDTFLDIVFKDGELLKDHTLNEIRETLKQWKIQTKKA